MFEGHNIFSRRICYPLDQSRQFFQRGSHLIRVAVPIIRFDQLTLRAQHAR
jgi:hypothetical protein